jgi:copper homeostasis protein (lipoprotein)
MILNKIYKFAYMCLFKTHIFLALLISVSLFSCKSKPDKNYTVSPLVIKGIYSCAPGAKTFQACSKQTEFWVADSSAQLELKYSQLVSFEKPGEPVYIEVEGEKIKSATVGNAAYDSTLVVKKLIKITKDIPADCK